MVGKKNLYEFLETGRAVRSQKVTVQAAEMKSALTSMFTKCEKYSQIYLEQDPTIFSADLIRDVKEALAEFKEFRLTNRIIYFNRIIY